MNPVRAVTNSSAFRSLTKSGPGAALLGSRAFRRLNGARRHAAAGRAVAKDPERFTGVRTFCFFIGHMKSGTSLLGSLLDAHPDVVLADEVDALRHLDQGYGREELFHLLDRGAAAEADKGRVTARRLDGGYSLAVAGGSQGRSERPLVIGDGRAGPTTQRLAQDPEILGKLRDVLGEVRIRVVHVIRNPFDPIALSSIRGARPLAEAIDHYFARCEALVRVRELFAPEELVALRYEDLVGAPRERLAEICAFVGVEPTPAYLDACAGLVRPDAERSRDRVTWPAEAIADVERRIGAFPFLAGYSFGAGAGARA